MLRSITVSLVAAVLATAHLPSAAQAQACTGRPGASAIEQYCEAIPDGDGDRVTGSGGGSGSNGGSSGSSSSQRDDPRLPPRTASALQAGGPDGKAVLGLVARESASDDSSKLGSAERGGSSAGRKGEATTAPSVVPAKTPSDNPLRAVSAAAANGATVGSMFLWGLLALAVAALAAGWIGFRRSRDP